MAKRRDREQDTPMKDAIATFFGYVILELFGHLNEALRKMGFLRIHSTCEEGHENYVPLYQDFADFYKRYVFRRIRDCWNRPICSTAGAEFTLMNRTTSDHGWHFQLTGTTTRAINLGSYNYLGFADNSGPCTDATEITTKTYGGAVCSSQMELGTLDIHRRLESLMSRFLGVEDTIAFGMGFATNSLNIPTLLEKGCLIVSDELNHASIILGSRLSRASISVFKHNNMQDLEKKLREAVVYGQPRTHRPWRKILIMVEGVYSMEGTIVNLPEVVRLKKKYKAYLYLDEAHSIGALGPTGRGVIDYYGVNPRDVDVLMGTFTKSFGAVGGYIAGSKRLINHIRSSSFATHYAASMSAAVAQQVISSVKIIMGEDGTDEGQKRINQLAANTRYFRKKMDELGFLLYGDKDSPIVPVLMFMPSKITLFTRLALDDNIAVVPVGFPATPIDKCRVRFCISAAHTKEMLDKTLAVCSKVGDIVGCKYKRRKLTPSVSVTVPSASSTCSTVQKYIQVWSGPNSNKLFSMTNTTSALLNHNGTNGGPLKTCGSTGFGHA